MNISVIGQGYVGLTVSIAAASAGHRVVGFDINKVLISDLANGQTYVPGIDENDIKLLINKNYYCPTTDPTAMRNSEIVIIAVPTPLDSERNPDLRFLKSAIQIIYENLAFDALIVNESTSYPGTLRDIIKPLLEKNSKQKFMFAAAPERVDPGNSSWVLANTPRVISGLDTVSTDKAVEFYSTFCGEIHRASTPEVAEAAKLFENTFRQVNIALVNEFSEISAKLGFSANEAIIAASTKPFGYMPFYPSIGVGGHCIPVDPSYLSYIAEKNGVKASFINIANHTNLDMPQKIARRIEIELGGTLRRKKIQLAGISYKPNTSDLRESPAIQLIIELEKLGAEVSWFDPLVIEYDDQKSQPLDPLVDLGLIISPHDLINFSVWLEHGTNVLDLSANSKSYGWPKFL